MNIEAYISCHNDEKLLPYAIKHYSQFAKVILVENNSTDDTVKIGSSLGAEVRSYQINNDLDEHNLVALKENCWLGSTADWAMVVDTDEFVYHPNIVEILKNTEATIIHPSFHNMFSEKYPTTKGQIYEEVTMGTDGDFWLSKINTFRPKEIISMDWSVGCHFAYPKGNVIIDNNTGIKTLHMRFLSREYVIERHKYFKSRLNKECVEKGYGVQFNWSEEETNKYFDSNIPKLKKIV